MAHRLNAEEKRQLVATIKMHILSSRHTPKLGRKLPNRGQEFEAARQFRFRYSLSEGVQKGDGQVYLCRIRANWPIVGRRELSFFGSLQPDTDWILTHDASKLGEKFVRVKGRPVSEMARAILLDHITPTKLEHSGGKLLPPEECDIPWVGTAAQILTLETVSQSDVDDLCIIPTMEDGLRAEAIVSQMESTDEGVSILRLILTIGEVSTALRGLEVSLEVREFMSRIGGDARNWGTGEDPEA